VKYTIAFPDRVRSDLKLPMGELSQAFDGKSGWAKARKG